MRRLRVAQQRGFGDLDFEPVRGQAGDLERVADFAQDVALMELVRREEATRTSSSVTAAVAEEIGEVAKEGEAMLSKLSDATPLEEVPTVENGTGPLPEPQPEPVPTEPEQDEGELYSIRHFGI